MIQDRLTPALDLWNQWEHLCVTVEEDGINIPFQRQMKGMERNRKQRNNWLKAGLNQEGRPRITEFQNNPSLHTSSHDTLDGASRSWAPCPYSVSGIRLLGCVTQVVCSWLLFLGCCHTVPRAMTSGIPLHSTALGAGYFPHRYDQIPNRDGWRYVKHGGVCTAEACGRGSHM